MPITFNSIEAHSVPWTSRSSSAWRDSTQHLLPVVKMTEQTPGVFSSRVWEVEAGGCCSLFSSRLCRIPYPKYMIDPSRERRRWEGSIGALPPYKCPIGLLLLSLDTIQGWGKEDSYFQSLKGVSFSKEASYQWLSRYQIGSRSQCSSASSSKCSETCSPVGGQAEQGPVGNIN